MGWAAAREIGQGDRRTWQRALSGRFARDERGVTSIIFGIIFTCLLLCAAVAIDYSRATREHSDEQAAIDAAVIAAAAEYSKEGDQAAAEVVARAYFSANMSNTVSNASITAFSVDTSSGEIVANGGTALPTTLMRTQNVQSMNIATAARAAFRKSGIEVALVLDNSSSMSGDPLTEMIGGALALNSVLFTGVNDSDLVKVGVVPFAGAVNVGSHLSGEDWIDQGNFATDTTTVYWENLGYSTETKVSRFDLFSQLGSTWAGCVEVRPGSHDTEDTPAVSDDPTSYFIPMFAPDEPDDENTDNTLVQSYPNSYLTDYKDGDASCAKDEPTCLKTNKKTRACTEWSTSTVAPPVKAQQRLCKYSSVTPNADKPGPNMNCDSNALTPLTGTKTVVDAAINAMTSSGQANIAEGVMWGLRVLSSTAPFTEGAPYSDTGTAKYMILLARGSNSITVVDNDDLNKSEYTPWGYSVNGRLNPQSTQETALTNSMNQKSRSACREATDAGVKVYSIGFGVSDAHTRSMLQYCASTPHMNFDVDSGAELNAVFEAIGRELLNIRLSG